MHGSGTNTDYVRKKNSKREISRIALITARQTNQIQEKKFFGSSAIGPFWRSLKSGKWKVIQSTNAFGISKYANRL